MVCMHCEPFAPCVCHCCAGFDVWMANTRGNTFSRGNYYYSFRDFEYWYHSIDQYAQIDLPAQVNTALAVSGAKKLAIVGHSQVSGMLIWHCNELLQFQEETTTYQQ